MKKSKLNLITKGLFNDSVKEYDVLREFSPGKLMYQDRFLTPFEKNNLISQAQIILKLDLYNMLSNEMKQLCQQKIYFDSKDQFDIALGKMGLWLFDTYEKKLKKLSTMKPDSVPEKK